MEYRNEKGEIDLPIGTRFRYKGKHGIVSSYDDATSPCVCDECMLDSGEAWAGETCSKVCCTLRFFAEILPE